MVPIRATEAQSYGNHSVGLILTPTESAKYVVTADARHASFSSLVLLVNRVMNQEARIFFEEASWALISPFKLSRLVFATISATDTCLKGSCVRWWSGMGMDGGPSVPVTVKCRGPKMFG